MVQLFKSEIREWFLSTDADVLNTSSSSSDNEDIKMENNKKERISKIDNFVEAVVPSYSDETFKHHFRLSRSTAYRLIERFQTSEYLPHSSNKMSSSAEKCVLLCLWYLANEESFRQISDRFKVALSTAHKLLTTVVEFILSLRSEFIKWPNTTEQKQKISSEFQKKQGFSNVIGCIDGSHVQIQKPMVDEEAYVNRKRYHSVLIQGICDHRKLFLDIYCGEPGSMHDARLLRKSSIYQKAENAAYFGNFYLLGDSAYPSLPWLVPPFKDNGMLTEEQKNFNFRLSSTRMVIEHSFGLLKGRFRRIGHFENLNIKLIVKCIMAACVLHNMCILENDLLEEVEPGSQLTEADDPDEATLEAIFCSTRLAKHKRDEVFRNMFN